MFKKKSRKLSNNDMWLLVIQSVLLSITATFLVQWWIRRKQAQEDGMMRVAEIPVVEPVDLEIIEVRVKTVEAEPEPEPAAQEQTDQTADQPAETPAAKQPDTQEDPEPDDLTRVEGIGPKTTSALNAAGIKTFRQLADLDQERLRAILLEANLLRSNPATWPEQARMAADGEWEKLEQWQNRLQGGRREG